MNKYQIRRLNSEVWNSAVGYDIYEAAENYASSDMDESSEMKYEIKKLDEDKTYKVIVEMSASFNAYDLEKQK